MKAIETKYKGYRFRSRLEARWAVFFDALGLEWMYEPEGIDLGNGVWYLPDFYLPKFGGWLEVKAGMPTQADLKKFVRLAAALPYLRKGARQEISMICGTPGDPKINLDLSPDSINPGDGYFILSCAGQNIDGKPFVSFDSFAYVDGGKTLDVWPIYIDAEWLSIPCTIIPVEAKSSPSLKSISLWHGFVRRMYYGNGIKYKHPKLTMAYNAARSARFEHGESGD